LPVGWAMTDARATPGAAEMRPGAHVCPGLDLDYVNLWAVSDGRLHLWVTSETCRDQMGTAAWGKPFTVGAFSGAVEEVGSDTYGTMSNGSTVVSFSTDLSADDAARLLASLVPFDAAADPPRARLTAAG
jgi:hypothetical protein